MRLSAYVPFVDSQENIDAALLRKPGDLGAAPEGLTYGEVKRSMGIEKESAEDDDPITLVQWRALRLLGRRKQSEGQGPSNDERGAIYRARASRPCRRGRVVTKD